MSKTEIQQVPKDSYSHGQSAAVQSVEALGNQWPLYLDTKKNLGEFEARERCKQSEVAIATLHSHSNTMIPQAICLPYQLE